MQTKSALSVLAIMLLTCAIAMIARGDEPFFDGVWWRSIDHYQRLGYVDGYIDCYEYIKRGLESFAGTSPESLEDGITAYYERSPKENRKPVTEVLRSLGLSKTSEPNPPTFGLLDGEYWRQGGPLFRVGFIQGYFACLGSAPKLRARFPKPTEWYVQQISEWYGVKDNDPAAIELKKTRKPIAQVLFMFASKR